MRQTQAPGSLPQVRQAAPVFVGPACQQVASAYLHGVAQLYLAQCTPPASPSYGVCQATRQLPSKTSVHAPQPAPVGAFPINGMCHTSRQLPSPESVYAPQPAPVVASPINGDCHTVRQLPSQASIYNPQLPAASAIAAPINGVCPTARQPLSQPSDHAPQLPANPAAAKASRWQPGGESLRQFLAAVQEARTRPNERELAYQSFLCAIQQWGLLDGIPASSDKAMPSTTRVSLPFCGHLSETPILLPFLAKYMKSSRCQTEVHACDVDDSASTYWWPAWADWTTAIVGPQWRLTCEKKDLAEEILPSKVFGLVLGVHPLVMGTGCEVPWRRIMANVLQSCRPGGRCIFATFYTFEAEKVQSICRDLGHSSEIRENPCYAGAAKDQMGTHLRFVVIVDV
eukprot:TRINITY_DN2563_c0_g1_i1.p1 TRINITY_DN2563_c0_g1~~TRINITY_DN2563_c0_g1_i1.p1  ORF type:complete len:399 (-),score=61.45 TRINITY_DN2563_c0_g1_i1:63-1259(-)